MDARFQREAELLPLFDVSVSALGVRAQQGLQRAKDFSSGSWLSAVASEKNGNVSFFRAGVQKRLCNCNAVIQRALLQPPGSCDGCEKVFPGRRPELSQ